MKILLWILTTAFAINACAQNTDALKYAKLIDTTDARKHLTILASDAFEGRETGTPGAEKAANYIAGEFKNLGLKPPVNNTYFQQVALLATSFEVQSFRVNQKSLSNGKDFYFSGTPDAATLNGKEILFVGYGISTDEYDDLRNIDISGKIVMFINKGEPVNDGKSVITKTKDLSEWSNENLKKIRFLQSKKPALLIAVSPDVAGTLKNYHSSPRLSIKKNNPAITQSPPPIVNITPEVADILLKQGGKTVRKLQEEINRNAKPATQIIKADFHTTFGPKIKDVIADNVLGYLEGGDLKEELLVISAHYDHVGILPEGTPGDRINNGADDDGSGTTGIIEIARAFSQAKKDGKGPRRSILFLAVCGEEKGLLGSEWYSEHPVFPLQHTFTNLNIDMIGRIDPSHAAQPDYCYLIGSDKLSSDLHKISETANNTYTKLHIDYKYNDPKDPERIYYRSDHYNFAKHGIPIIFYFNGVHEDYHKPSDEVSKINFDLLVKRAQLVYFTAWELVHRNERPVVDVSNDMPASR
ncbi:MAG: M28 family peptidase [Sphingobacteriaceae bacterium]